jgi:hypothetical protein
MDSFGEPVLTMSRHANCTFTGSTTPKCLSRLSVLLVAAAIVACFSQTAAAAGRTDYYSSEQLTNKSIPSWNPTNSIPLSPDKAVIAAIKYANSKRPNPLSWDVDGVELVKYSPQSSWFYSVTLTDRKSGAFESEIVRVLMNGEVWEPKGNKK